MEGKSYLDGQMLLAMPGIGDPRFERSLIYVCAHSEEGAMGIIVNRYAEDINFPDLLERLGIISTGEQIDLPDNVQKMHVHVGGPVEIGRGFVLHSSDYFVADCTLPIGSAIGLTATLDVYALLPKAMARTGSCWHWAIPVGGRASWKMKSCQMAGCTAMPARN